MPSIDCDNKVNFTAFRYHNPLYLNLSNDLKLSVDTLSSCLGRKHEKPNKLLNMLANVTFLYTRQAQKENYSAHDIAQISARVRNDHWGIPVVFLRDHGQIF